MSDNKSYVAFGKYFKKDDMSEILLIKPPRDADMPSRVSPSLSLAYLAASLRTRFSVAVLDLQFFCFHAGDPAGNREWE